MGEVGTERDRDGDREKGSWKGPAFPTSNSPPRPSASGLGSLSLPRKSLYTMADGCVPTRQSGPSCKKEAKLTL
jgi:hypothetical protein